MELFIGNLPQHVTGGDLKKLVESYARVEKAKVVYQEEISRGFGFVTVSESDGNKVIKNLNGCFFEGKKLLVKKANSYQVPKKVFISRKWREKADEKV